jgi:inosine/xanthosine triphosphate pyrophosphatase family protein
MSTPAITEFLEARIADDEGLATEALPGEPSVWGARGWYDPARVLAECAAKRAIIELTANCDGYTQEAMRRTLAAAYSDHPDYRQEWEL